MTPSQATVGEGAAKQRGKAIPGWDGVAGRNRHDVGHGVFRSMWEEVRLLRSENKSLHGDFNALKGDFEALKEGFDRLLRSKGDVSAVRVGTDDAGQAKSQDESQDSKSQAKSQADGAAGGPSPKKKNNNNKKKKKKKKKGGKVANIFGDAGGNLGKVAGGASAAKAVVGLVSVVLLISIALGQGSLGKKSPSTWERKGGQPVTPNEVSTVLMTGSDAKLVGEEIITPVKVLLPTKQDRRMLGVIEESHDQEGQKDKLTEKSQEADVVAVESSTVKVFTTVGEVSSEGVVEANPPLMHEPKRKFGNSRSAFAGSPQENNDGASLPMAAPSDYPTYSPAAATVFSPTYECDADPERCGCPDSLQTDYRGPINITKQKLHCAKWNDDSLEKWPRAGLEGNFCRNPDYDRGGTWCYTTEENDADDYGYCNVPTCQARTPTASPTASAIPTLSAVPSGSPTSSSLPSSSPTQSCPVANNEECSCDPSQSDYRGMIAVTNSGHECARWDDEGLKPFLENDYSKDFPNSGLDENYCRNPDSDPSGAWCLAHFPNKDNEYFGYCNVKKCDPCECIPRCGQTNDEACACPSVFQAEECCNEDDASCKCHYLKDACSKSLENKGTMFCEDAEHVCCNDKKDNAYCKCEMYEQICSMSPGYSTCDFAAGSCCPADPSNWAGEQEQCFCDFYTYASEADIFTDNRGYESGNCSDANSFQFGGSSKELIQLRRFYEETRGKYWYKKTHWLSNTVPHCQWFGLKCDAEGHITDISLRNNNLNGGLWSLEFHRLEKLDLAGNNLSGEARSYTVLFHRRLIHIDISDNQFSGHADMSFPPTTIHVNYSSNAFTSVGFKRFSPSYETLQVVDLRDNSFELDASNIFVNVPPRLEEFYLSNNVIRGALPHLVPLENLRIFNIANTAINGHLPDFSSPLLRKLDLSNQKQNGGLIGKIPTAYSTLDDLVELNLAGNKLTGDIPSFAGALEVLDLSSNKLTNRIPLGLTNLKGAIIHLSGNSNISSPAPLDLCFFPKFDLRNDTSLCPPERNALKEFYNASKGQEWDNHTNWLDPYTSHCEWHGVTCSNETQNTINLTLKNNGLSGRLNKHIKYISNLPSLEVLDLSENEMKGTIPPEIGLLSSLTKLLLRYNNLDGTISKNFGHLQHLEVIHLHGNRLTGTVPKLNFTKFSGNSSYISDCGNPSDFDQSLVCEDCTMCCNALGDCYHTEQTALKKAGLDYAKLVGVFCACIFVACFILASALIAYDRRKNSNGNFPNSSIDRQSLANRDKIRALESIGIDSVYRFFLGTSWPGWIIALATIVMQILMLFVFVLGAEVNWTTDKTDLVYTWRCPRDQDKCRDTDDSSAAGWLAFVILMAAYLLVDIIKGIKMIVLSAKERHSHCTRMRYFIGGMLLITVTSLTIYVTAIYNAAIATNDREIIANSVIILLITDIDEHFCAISMLVNKDWVKRISYDEDHRHEHAEENQAFAGRISKEEEDEEDGLRIYSPPATEPDLPTPEESTRVQTLQDQVNTFTELVQALQKTVAQQAEELEKLQKEPQRLQALPANNPFSDLSFCGTPSWT